jgi:uncharacterized protein YraI
MMMEMNEQYVIVELDEEELEEVAGGRHVQSTGNGVHIRKGPGTTYSVIGKVNKGDRLTYDGAKDYDRKGVMWYAVKWNGVRGWICSKYARPV